MPPSNQSKERVPAVAVEKLARNYLDRMGVTALEDKDHRVPEKLEVEARRRARRDLEFVLDICGAGLEAAIEADVRERLLKWLLGEDAKQAILASQEPMASWQRQAFTPTVEKYLKALAAALPSAGGDEE